MHLLKLVEALKKNQWHAPPNFPLNRKKRWEELVSNIPQLIVNRNVMNQKYVAFSDIKLDQVSSIYNIENYVQNRFSIPDADFEQLHSDLNLLMNAYIGDNEARKVHMISPVLWFLTRIVPGLELSFQENFCGKSILLRGRFEFVLYQEKRRVGLVQAKKEDMDQGLSQLLMGQEVMCEMTSAETAVGVISNFDRWDFIRNEPEKIFRDEKNQILYEVLQESGEICINKESLRVIVEKFCGLLHENTS
jgi:hypothetical protein